MKSQQRNGSGVQVQRLLFFFTLVKFSRAEYNQISSGNVRTEQDSYLSPHDILKE